MSASHCPRLTVSEDALAAQLVVVGRDGVQLTAHGREVLSPAS
jgi:DNA-binding transcriptional LysR family regulator